jgi:uncharacterized membrane protein YphA (DoxX/SURF4 family)
MRTNNALAVLRIYLGVIFAIAVRAKIAAGPAYPGMLQGFLAHVGLTNGQSFYVPFLANTVIPHIGIFAVLVIVAETCVAIALITGTATRLAGVVAMFLVMNYMFAKGMWWWYPASNDSADFFIALALVIGAAGRTCGFDAKLAARFPRVPFW